VAIRHALRGAPLHKDYLKPGLLDHSLERFRRGAGTVLL
jgi:hypothetical protein